MVFLVFLRLGLTSFGGPVAHLAFFREEFVVRRRWLDEARYADLVALCQFLPGPASSQVGMALGLMRAGHRGALAAWCGFTLPSAVLLIALASGISHLHGTLPAGVLQGLKLAALAVVAQAVWGMGRQFCRSPSAQAVMAAAAVAVLVMPGVWTPVLIILLAGALGRALARAPRGADPKTAASPLSTLAPPSPQLALIWLAVFALLLVALPLASKGAEDLGRGREDLAFWISALAQADAFYRAGALVFGGGHVVLPLLQSAVVPPGWVAPDVFLAGYGAAQAVPGPLFTFSAFLGASMTVGPSGWLGGLLCLVAIFLPSYLLVAGTLPFWESLRERTAARAALAGINAAVVGLLLAVAINPLAASALKAPVDALIALGAFVVLWRWKAPPWAVVAACAVGRTVVSAV